MFFSLFSQHRILKMIKMFQDGICDSNEILNSTPPKKVKKNRSTMNIPFSLSSSSPYSFRRPYTPTLSIYPTSRCKSTYRTPLAKRIKSSLQFTLKQRYQSFRSLNFSSLDNTRSLYGYTIDSKRTKSTPDTS